jgi:hypothetical protein
MTTEQVEERIRVLELHDQALRASGASALELEANRLAIVACQWELARRLLGPPEAAVAA